MTSALNAAERSAQAQRNRDAMPLVAAMLDATRAVFGQQCRIVYAREGGREVGRKPEDTERET